MLLKKNSTIKKQGGVTLVELLISLTVFLLGIATIYGVLKIANLQKNTVNSRTDQLRSARISLEYLRRDILNAGFGYHRTGGNIPDNAGNGLFGISADSDTQRDLLTSVISGNDVNTNSLTFGIKTDVIALITRDSSFNNGALINYTGAAASGTSVNISTAANDCGGCNKYDVYLFESSSGTTQVLGMVTNKNSNNSIQLTPGDPLGLNQSATATGDNQSLLATTAGGGTFKRINIISYSVTNNSVLVRTKYGNQTDKTAAEQREVRELVYGVSDFQIQYYMEDGTTVSDPSSQNNGRTNQLKMNSVVQVQISITLAPDSSNTQPGISQPVTIKEFISTKNLRYEAS